MTATLPTTYPLPHLPSADFARSLRAVARGDVITPGDRRYPAAAFGFDPKVAAGAEVLLIATRSADVAAAVALAARSGRRVAVETTRPRVGAGRGEVQPGLLIVTRLLATVEVDPEGRRAVVGAGASWRQVLAAAELFGLVARGADSPGGRSATGQIRSGAVVADLAPSDIISVEVVTAHGDVVRVLPRTDPALFRSLLARSTTFGVITSLTVRLVPLPPLYAGSLWFDAADAAAAVLAAWPGWVRQLPTAATAALDVVDVPNLALVPAPLRGRRVLRMRFAHAGDPNEGARLLTALRLAASAVADDVAVRSYLARRAWPRGNG